MAFPPSQVFKVASILLCGLWILLGCAEDGATGPDDTEPPVVDRYAAIPADAVKATPAGVPFGAEMWCCRR